MVQWLDRSAQRKPGVALPPRTARVQVIICDGSGPGQLHELLVDLDASEVVRKEHLPGKHSYIDAEYMQAVEAACRSDSRVQQEIEKLQLPAGSTIVIEPWAYATDGEIDVAERTSMVSLIVSCKECKAEENSAGSI